MDNNYIFIATKMIDNIRDNIIIEGIVERGTIKVKDSVYILGPRNSIIKTNIKSIKTPQNKLIKSASKDENIKIILSNISNENLYKGDIITNIKPIILSDGSYYFENIRLNALLNYMEKFHDHEIINFAFDEIIMNAHLFAIIDDINFKIIKNSQNKFFIPVYTNIENAKNNSLFKDNCKIQVMTFDDMKETILDNEFLEGFVINPSTHQITLDKESVNRLSIQKENIVNTYTTEEIDPNTDIIFEEITDIPNELIDKLISYFIKKDYINKCWILDMKYNNTKSHLLVVDIDNNIDNTFYEISQIVNPYLVNTPLDMIAYNTKDTLEFSKKAIKNIIPFYER